MEAEDKLKMKAKAEEVLNSTMKYISEWNLEVPLPERKQLLTQSLTDKFGFTIQESKRIVESTFKALDSIPVEIIDVHKLYKDYILGVGRWMSMKSGGP